MSNAILSREALLPIVLVNGKPDEAMIVQYIKTSAGGSKLDYARIKRDLGRVDELVEDFALTKGMDKEVEIHHYPDGRQVCLFWGKLKKFLMKTDTKEEQLYEAIVEPHHFGIPLTKIPYTFGWNSTPVLTDLPLVFNPEIDKKVRPNLFLNFRGGARSSARLLHPESIATSNAVSSMGLTQESIERWTIASAIDFLCSILNPIELYIENPPLWKLEEIFPKEDNLYRFDNIKIPFGKYLPEILDMILEPFNASWKIDYRPGKRQIVVFRKDVPYAKDILIMQAHGEDLDPRVTNTKAFSLTYDFTNMVNVIEVASDYVEFEATVELSRAWETNQDIKQPDELEEGTEAYRQYPRVWRDWVLNEAGDYTTAGGAISPPIRDVFQNGPFDLAGFLNLPAEYFPPRRRKIYPTITHDVEDKPIGQHGGVLVEWLNPHPVDGGGEKWQPVQWPVDILEHEIGIRFNGNMPPAELVALADNARIRVTGTFRSDVRWHIGAGPGRMSLNSDLAKEYLILDHLKYRIVTPLSRFYKENLLDENTTGATAIADTMKSGEADNRKEMLRFVQAAQASWDRVEVNGSAILEGLDRLTASGKYQIGRGVKLIQGRDINLSSRGEELTQVPVIMGLDYDIQEQSVTLHLNTAKNFIDRGYDG